MPPLPTCFVGRAAEGRRFLDLLRACQKGCCRLLLLTGPPGIGKSVLADRFVALASSKKVRVARCSYGGDTATDPYGPFLDALGQLDGDRADRLRGWRRRALASIFDEGSVDLEQQHFLLQEGRESWEGQLIEALILAIRQRPTVVRLGHLHRTTETVWRFLTRLLRAATQEPLLIVATMRQQVRASQLPSQVAFRAAALEQLVREGLVERIGLQPLSASEIDEILHLTFPDAAFTETFMHHVRSVAGGNPGRLMAELQRLVDESVLTSSHGFWWDHEERITDRLHRAGSKAPSPPSLAAEVGAVLGESVSDQLRRQVIRRMYAARDQLIRQGVTQENRVEVAEPLEMPPGECQQVLEGISPERRRRLHYRIAQILERTEASPGVVELVAAHYAASDQRWRALPFLDRLSADCLRAFAFMEAQRHDRLARTILLETGRIRSVEHVRVDLRLSWLARLHGQAQEALNLAQDLLLAETAAEAGLTESAILLQQALALRRLDDYEAALVQLRGCLQVEGGLSAFGRALILLEIGVAQFALSRHREAKRSFLAALDLAKNVRSEALQVRVLRDLGAVEMALAEPLKAVGYFGQCVALLKRLGDKRRLAYVYFFLGLNQAQENDWTAANRALRRALALSDHLGLHGLKVDAYFKRSLVLLELGRFSEARDHARKACQLLEGQRISMEPSRDPIDQFLETAAAGLSDSAWSQDDGEVTTIEEPQPVIRKIPEVKIVAYREQLKRQLFY